MPPETSLLRDSRSPFVSEPDLIRPRKIDIGGVSQTASKFDFKYIWILAAVLVAALLLFALILLAPEAPLPIEPPEASPPASTTAQPAPASTQTPLELERQRRALADANAKVKRFTELEIELEDSWNTRAWGEAGLAQARQAAAEAEAAFAGSQYEQALVGYQQGIDLLESLLVQARDEYQAAIGRAVEALDQRDAEAAEEALANAATYQPESVMVEAGRKRLERLPELSALIDQASRAESSGAIDEAIRLIEAARALDAQTNGISARLAKLRQLRFDNQFKRTLAQAYEALEAEDYASAEDAFTTALGMNPNDPGARQGLEQTRLTQTNLAIQAALAEAREFANGEDWASAIEAFARVLEIDANLNEASAGLDQARARHALDQSLTTFIADPGRLADNRHFESARTLLQSATETRPRGERIEQQTRQLAAQIDYASQPAELTLVSDSNTDVRLQYHGDLGRFTTYRVETRPGRYLIRGGRDGFREVRFEVNLAPGPQRVEVICVEPIN